MQLSLHKAHDLAKFQENPKTVSVIDELYSNHPPAGNNPRHLQLLPATKRMFIK